MPHSHGRSTRVSSDFAFEIGQSFRHGSTVFRIAAQYGQYFTLEHTVSLDRRHITFAELTHGILRGEIVPCTEEEITRSLLGDSFLEDDSATVITGAISLLSDSAKLAGLKVIKYVQALKAIGYTTLRPTPLLSLDLQRTAQRFNDLDPPKLSTLYRWSLEIERAGGDLRAAFPNYADRGGRGKSRLQPQAQDALQKILGRLGADPKAKLKYTWVANELFHDLRELHGREQAVAYMPSMSTVTRETKKAFGAYAIYVRKHGKKAADRKFRTWYPRDRATEPLEVVEFDDKDTAVFGIDDLTKLPYGRIYLTAGVDQESGIPMGTSISPQARNTWSAINALVNSVLPKDLTQPEWADVTSEVPFMGKMGIAVFDNALYNHSAALEVAAFDIANATIAWAKPYTPTEKSAVERFNGTMMSEFLVTLPGFAGAKKTIDNDSVLEGMRSANLSIEDFRRRFNHWAYDAYCNKPRESGRTPRQHWEVGMLGRRSRIPRDVNRVLIAAMPGYTTKLHKEQIRFNGLIYQNQRLDTLRRRLGHNAVIEFKQHPEKIEKIFVRDAINNEWFEVPSANPEYTRNLTLYQHKLIQKMARDDKVKNPSVPQYIDYRVKLSRLVEQLRWSTKLKERKIANRIAISHSPDAGFHTQTQTVTVTVTDLESSVNEIDAVEMELGDEGWEF